jgi:LacI family transcriptional regulator
MRIRANLDTGSIQAEYSLDSIPAYRAFTAMATSNKKKPKKPTINDVARLSGVAKVTVSRVINNSRLVTPDTRRKVEAAIEQLNYAPDKQARGLAFKRSFLLGLVFDNPNALYVSEIQRGILSVCRQAGFELIMHPSELANPALGREISQFVAGAQVDGVIFMSPVSQDDSLARRMKKDHVPYVRISPKKNDALARVVVSNDRHGAELMTEHLIALGHRRIGFITGPAKNLSAQQKLEGFRESMRRHGLKIFKDLVKEGENTFDSGVRAGQVLLRRRNRPTAIFASNDEMALGVMKTAALLGISVPGELSVAGFDDSAVATVVWPDLTTVRQPLRQIGANAANKLLAQLNGSDAKISHSVDIEPELVVRNSTRSPE